jgi:hypothetical protein
MKTTEDKTALDTPAPAMGELVEAWQPIETAPKDGTRIMAYWPDVHGVSNATQAETWFGPRSVGWDDACWQTAYEWGDGYNDPTHWKPLDPPPQVQP